MKNRIQKISKKIKALLRQNRFEELNTLIENYEPEEIAENFQLFSFEEQLKILSNIDVEMAVDIFEDLDHEHDLALLKQFRKERIATFLDEMAPDDRADFFMELPPELSQRFLSLMDEEEAEDVKELLQYDENSAGGIMTTEFAYVKKGASVGDAIAAFREDFRDFEHTYYIYVLDESETLIGYLTMKDLLTNSTDSTIEDIMHTNPVTVPADMDQENVADELSLYDYVSIPVVDDDGKMLGIVTFDDVVDVISEEATEDIEKFGGVIHTDEAYMKSTLFDLFKKRIPWLIAFLFLSSGSTFLLAHYKDVFGGDTAHIYIMLVILLPMLTATAGNAGTQSATIVIRGLTTGEIDYQKVLRILWRESWVGLMMGICVGIGGVLRTLLITSQQSGVDSTEIFYGMTVFLSLVIIVMIATVSGAFLPILFKRLGLDPAIMSSPMIATVIDIVSVVVYFTIALSAIAYFSRMNISLPG